MQRSLAVTRAAWALLQAHHSPGGSRLAGSQEKVYGACVVLTPKVVVYGSDRRGARHRTRSMFSALEVVFSAAALACESLLVAGGVR